MSFVQRVVIEAPEVFLFLAIAIGAWLGHIRIGGFAIGAAACTLVVAVILGQLGHFNISPTLRSVLFAMFVFSIGYRSGPQFFASLSIRTLAQVALALVIGATGLAIVLTFAFTFKLSSGTAAGLAAGALTQSSMLGTASGALVTLGLSEGALAQEQGNLAAGYAVTYILGYIMVLLFVPFVAPRLMGANLKEEAAKLEQELAGGASPKKSNVIYRKFQARAYAVSAGDNRAIADIEAEIGRRTVIERIVRDGADVEVRPDTRLKAGDRVLVVGPTAAVVAVERIFGAEIEGEDIMRDVSGETVDIIVSRQEMHGRSLNDIVERIGNSVRGVFLKSLTRHGQDVPVTPNTVIYVGDRMTLLGLNRDIKAVAARVGQIISLGDHVDIVFIAAGLAVGLGVGMLKYVIGPIPLTLGGGGGALIAGLVCGWLNSRRPTIGSLPPAAQHTMTEIGLLGFIAAIGLGNGQAAWIAIQANGPMLLMMGTVVTVVPMVVGTLFARYVLHMNPVITCGALAGSMTVDAAVAGSCDVAQSQTPVLGVAVPYAMANVVLTVLGPIIVGVVSAA